MLGASMLFVMLVCGAPTKSFDPPCERIVIEGPSCEQIAAFVVHMLPEGSIILTSRCVEQRSA